MKRNIYKNESGLAITLRCREKNKKPEKNLAFVELLGFEPRQTEPKSVVLPLHHSSIRKECKNKGMAMMYQIFLLPPLRRIATGRGR